MSNQKFAINNRVLVFESIERGYVGGIILNKKLSVNRRGNIYPLFLVSTPFDISWVRHIKPFRFKEFQKCLRPHPCLVSRGDLLPEHVRDYLGSWEFIHHHPDLQE
jgi:hypothetical protein